jgi:preprotein translocase subunit SecE
MKPKDYAMITAIIIVTVAILYVFWSLIDLMMRTMPY